MALKIETKPITSYDQNCRLLIDTVTNEGVIVDPGGDAEQLAAWIVKSGITLRAIWLTHSHLDHCGGVKPLLEQFPVPLFGHPEEKMFRERVAIICQMYGTPDLMVNCPEPDNYITGGETLQVGSHKFGVRFTPGHAPGHLCFYCATEGVLIAGDTVFRESIGRTDLPGGNHAQLIASIHKEIFTLPHQTKILPGHGPDTTVGHEIEHNPFL